MEKISWTDYLMNEEVLHRVREKGNIRYTIERGNGKCTGHILSRNCLMKHVIEAKTGGMMEVVGIQGRRRKQLLDNLKATGRHGKLKETY
jgi:hypothetical protein